MTPEFANRPFDWIKQCSTSLRRHGPFWLSIFAGIAIWEIAGRSTSQAFMVPFTVTIKALWGLILSGEFIRQFHRLVRNCS